MSVARQSAGHGTITVCDNPTSSNHRRVEALQASFAQQEKDFQATVAQQQKQIEALTAGLQKVSAEIEMSRAAPQLVENNR